MCPHVSTLSSSVRLSAIQPLCLMELAAPKQCQKEAFNDIVDNAFAGLLLTLVASMNHVGVFKF